MIYITAYPLTQRINPMRKLLLTTAAVAAAIAGAFAREPSFGTFTDARDGQTYKTVTIGTQTWMARNINYQTKSGSWCYDNNVDNCKQYGRLYDWNTAKTACPAGWHLPSRWDNLEEEAAVGGKGVAGKALKSTNGWYNDGNGIDNNGFSALPGGYRDTDGSFYHVGKYGYWWTATEYGGGIAYSRLMGYGKDIVGENYGDEGNGFSVRCVADNP
jgi:uncharacterized protein (TIGR02145 family)